MNSPDTPVPQVNEAVSLLLQLKEDEKPLREQYLA
jgi:hypothetical protein